METCENCGRVIGTLETPHVHDDHIICAACDVILTEAPAATQSTALEPAENATGGTVIPWLQAANPPRPRQIIFGKLVAWPATGSILWRDAMWKWAAGILGAVLLLLLAQGLWNRAAPIPAAPPSVPKYSVTGFWTYTMESDVSGNTNTGRVTLTQDGTTVSGAIEDVFDNSKSGLKGTLSGNTLELSRDTGRDTVQTYRLFRQGNNRLEGTFTNVGKYPDSGLIAFDR